MAPAPAQEFLAAAVEVLDRPERLRPLPELSRADATPDDAESELAEERPALRQAVDAEHVLGGVDEAQLKVVGAGHGDLLERSIHHRDLLVNNYVIQNYPGSGGRPTKDPRTELVALRLAPRHVRLLERRAWHDGVSLSEALRRSSTNSRTSPRKSHAPLQQGQRTRSTALARSTMDWS